MSNQQFRTCPESGLQFHKPAALLMRANAVVAVVILLIGGISALGVTLTRMPAVHLLPADRFYQLLTTHGVNMLIFWIIFFEIAVLYFCSSTLLRSRLATPRIAWLGFALVAADNLDAAEAAHNRSRDLGFGTFSLRGLAQISARRGDFATARKTQEIIFQESSASGNPLPEFYLAAVDAWYAGKASDELLAKFDASAQENPGVWQFYLAVGELEKAVAVFSRDAQPKPDGQPASTVAHALVWFPVYRAIVEHPGFLEHAKVIKLYDYWEQHGYPDHCPRVDDHLECDSE